MLSTPGIGSGLDISSIISQLMAIEAQPLVQLGVDEIELQAQLSGIGKLKSTVSTFQTAMQDLSDLDKFKVFAATSSDDEILTATADSTATKGVFNIQVNRIAENHRMATNTVFADLDTTKIGNPGDTMTITVGTTAFVVDIGDKTLNEIRGAINDAADNAGVTASTLQDDLGYRLTLSADETGAANFVSVSYSGTDPFSLQSLNTDRDSSGTFTSADLDASLTIENTFTVTRGTNVISDVIQGVTFNLEKAGSITLDIDRDSGKITSTVNQFISSFNEVISVMEDLKSDVLSSDRTSLRSLESQFRAILNTAADTTSDFEFLFELGVSTKLDGSLSLDTTIFDGALDSDPDGVAELFANNPEGIAFRLEDLAATLLQAGGLFDGREQSLGAQIDDIGDRRLNLEFRLVQKEATLVAQFSALDTLIAQLSTTSSFLTIQLEQIAAITNFSFNNNRR